MSERRAFWVALVVRYGSFAVLLLAVNSAGVSAKFYWAIIALVVLHGAAAHFHGALLEKRIQRDPA